MMPPHLGIRPSEQGLVHAEVRVGDYEDIAADQDMNDRRVGTYAETVSTAAGRRRRLATAKSQPADHRQRPGRRHLARPAAACPWPTPSRLPPDRPRSAPSSRSRSRPRPEPSTTRPLPTAAPTGSASTSGSATASKASTASPKTPTTRPSSSPAPAASAASPPRPSCWPSSSPTPTAARSTAGSPPSRPTGTHPTGVHPPPAHQATGPPQATSPPSERDLTPTGRSHRQQPRHLHSPGSTRRAPAPLNPSEPRRQSETAATVITMTTASSLL